MEFTEYKIGFYRRWQKRIMKICWEITAMIFVIEIAIAVFFRLSKGELDMGFLKYVLLRVVLPSSINLVTLVISSLLLHSPSISVEKKNYIASYMFLILTAVVAVFHNFYTVVLVSPCAAIFLVSLLTDRRLLLHIFIASLVVVAGASSVWILNEHITSFVLGGGTVIAVVAVHCCCYVFARGILTAQNEQVQFIYDGYIRQQQLINELRLEPLTRLYNRTALADTITNCIKVANREEHASEFMLALLDLDNFKSVNDTYGHASGDAVLISLAELIVKTLGGSRNAFRYGGDEFVVLFKDQSIDTVEKTAEYLCTQFADTKFDFMPDKSHCTISMGIALYHKGWNSKQWFEAADTAAYAAKAAGKNQFVVVP